MAKKKQVKQNKNIKAKEVPRGIKRVSIVYYILAVGSVLLSVFSVLAYLGILGSDIAGVYTDMQIGLNAFIFSIVFLLVMALIYFVLAIYLLRLKRWAMYLAVFVSVYNVVSAASNFNAVSIVPIAIHGIIFVYLAFNRKVQEAFR